MEYQEWHNVIDWDDELFVTAEILNQQFRDNLNFIRYPAYAVTNGLGVASTIETSLTLTSGFENSVPYDTVLYSSPSDFAVQLFGPGVTTFRTVPYSGIYLMVANVQFSSNATGDRYISINNSDNTGAPSTVLSMSRIAAMTINVKTLTTVAIARLIKGHRILAFAYQDSGGDLTIVEHSDNVIPTLSLTYLGNTP